MKKMRILIVNADCILVNSSANLCHLAYINGLVDAGHNIELLCASRAGRTLDEGMRLPSKVKVHEIDATSLYERISQRKNNLSKTVAMDDSPQTPQKQSPIKAILRGVLKKAKNIVLNLYGVHGIYAPFIKKSAKFKSADEFDYIISISTPVASHSAAYELIHSGNVKAKKWIQIWEDPWYGDVYSERGKNVYEEEKRLLSIADRVCYVSPLTLENQKKIFPESAGKMYWQPLPYYYKNDDREETFGGKNRYGYFGDYAPAARDLGPFYQAVVESEISVDICGNPSNLLASTANVKIHPRLPLGELKPIEDKTNVLIFLCNRKGGQIPGKIYQYSATRKTILFIMDGTKEEKKVLREYFEPFRRYVFCENNKESILAAIKQIEGGDIGDIKNEPVEDFNPQETIRRILECGR